MFRVTATPHSFTRFNIRGTYMLYNLLQELTRAKRFSINHLVLDESRLSENPINRLLRLMKDSWVELTRRIDSYATNIVARNPKNLTAHPQSQIYVRTARRSNTNTMSCLQETSWSTPRCSMAAWKWAYNTAICITSEFKSWSSCSGDGKRSLTTRPKRRSCADFYTSCQEAGLTSCITGTGYMESCWSMAE